MLFSQNQTENTNIPSPQKTHHILIPLFSMTTAGGCVPYGERMVARIGHILCVKAENLFSEFRVLLEYSKKCINIARGK